MPVDNTHPDYDANVFAWWRARDVYAGEDAVKAAGTRYLPRLDSQTDDEYAAYKKRASFFNAMARTAEGLVGLIFRREPIFHLPDSARVQSLKSNVQSRKVKPQVLQPHAQERALKQFVNDADMLGTRLTVYAKTVVQEIMLVGRAGSLVDWTTSSGGPMGSEDRAYAVLYQAEDILNWQTERVNGRIVLTMVVLRETVEGQTEEDFSRERVEQIRVLRLAPVQSLKSKVQSKNEDGGAQGQSLPRSHERSYIVEIWQRRGAKSRRGKTGWELMEIRTPSRRGKPLPLIPFVFHGPRHSLPVVDKLPLGDIIAVNLDHYRLNADYKHGLHFTALPTAWVSGFDKSSTLRIGSSTAWVAETPGATAGFLEFTGQGLTTFERAMDRDERLMAVLGTRMLESQKRVGESADAIELRQSGENSVLSAVSISVGDSLTQVLRWVYWWNSTEATPDAIGEDLVLAQLNADFGTKGMASDEITAIVAAWQANAISRETMFELFRKGEVLPAGRSNQEEARLVAKSGGEDGRLKMEDGKSGAHGVTRPTNAVVNETTQPEVVK